MKKYLLCIAFVLIVLSNSAQSQEQITGTWRSSRLAANEDSSVLTLFPDGIYQEVEYYKQNPELNRIDSVVEEGTWKYQSSANSLLLNRKVIYSAGREFANSWHRNERRRSLEFITFSDSVFQYKSSHERGWMEFRKTAGRARYYPSRFYLQKMYKPGRIISLDMSELDLTVEYRDSSCEMCFEYGQRRYTSRLLNLENDTLSLLTRFYTLDSSSHHFSVSQSIWLTRDTIIRLPMVSRANWYTIEYNSARREGLKIAGISMVIAGATTALLVAPLLSYKFSDGSFRTERYKNIAAGGLVSFGVGIPVSILFRTRTFQVNSYPGDECAGSWILKKY